MTARSATNEAIPAAHGPLPVLKSSPSLTRNQIRGFWASWGGWTLDGMDSFVYALVLVPSLRELLPRSGIAATKASIGHYGGRRKGRGRRFGPLARIRAAVPCVLAMRCIADRSGRRP
jgi:hypothetical protein